MNQSESSSLCTLALEESDLKKLEELDPFQTDGYQTMARVSIPVRIIYTDEKGKQTVDQQPLTFQLLTRHFKHSAAKVKQEAHLDSLRVCLSSQEDIFLSMASTMSSSTFESLKTKNQLNLQFKDFPNVLLGMLKNCSLLQGEGKNKAQLRLSYQGTGKFFVLQHTEYKQIQLAQLYFSGTNLQKAHQSIIYRYNFNRTKLTMIENSIESIYKLLASKNPPLLAYIQKTVGED